MRDNARDHLKALGAHVPDFELMKGSHLGKVMEHRRLKLLGKRKAPQHCRNADGIPDTDEEGEEH